MGGFWGADAHANAVGMGVHVGLRVPAARCTIQWHRLWSHGDAVARDGCTGPTHVSDWGSQWSFRVTWTFRPPRCMRHCPLRSHGDAWVSVHGVAIAVRPASVPASERKKTLRTPQVTRDSRPTARATEGC